MVFVTILPLVGQAEETKPSSLRLTLTSDQSVYMDVKVFSMKSSNIVGGAMSLNVRATNMGDAPLDVIDLPRIGIQTALATQTITLDLSDEYRHRASHVNSYCGIQEDYFPGDKTRRLAPGEVMEFSFVLNQRCAHSGTMSALIDRPGIYTITATFHGVVERQPSTDPAKIRFSSVTSNALTIKVDRWLE